MSYNPTQEDIALLYQSSRSIYARLEILNKSMKMVGTLEGVMISDRYIFDASANSRKTASISLYVSDSSFLIGNDRKIWFDKYIRLNIGIYSLISHEVVWYRIGTFIYTDARYSYDAATRQLDIELCDRMAEFDGTRNGVISGYQTKIYVDSPIRDAMVSTVTQLGGVDNFRITIDGTVPYDLEFNTGVTVNEIIAKLRDLNVGYETFFDDDVFICQRYPDTTADPVVLDDAITHDLVISENLSTSFTGVYNVVEVWGKCLDADTYTENVSYSGNVYSFTNTAISELSHGDDIGFKAPSDNLAGANLKINSFTAYPICDDSGSPISVGKIKAGKSYVVRYKRLGDTSYFYLLGEYQIVAVAKLVSKEPTDAEKEQDLQNNPTTNIFYVVEPDSPFGADLIGEIRNVLSGGEYDDIYSEDLAVQRAKYELWLSSDMKEEISLVMVDIPWLDVNQKIEYTPMSTGKPGVYMVRQKDSSTTEGTMNLSCVTFNPTYPWLDETQSQV